MSSNDRRRGRGQQQRKNDAQPMSEEQREQQDFFDNGIVVVPTNEDVLLGRGRSHSFHPGNVQFIQAVGMKLGAYLDASKKFQKSRVVNKIVNQALGQGIRFLEQDSDSKLWYDVGFKRARDKVGHALRDASRDKSRSIKNIHLDLLQRKVLETETVRRKNSATEHADLSVFNASATLTSFLHATHGIVASSENKGIRGECKYHVAKSHGEIHNESKSELEVSSSFSSQVLPVARSLSTAPRIKSTITTTTIKGISAKGMYHAPGAEDCSPNEEMAKISERKTSSHPSSRSSALDAYLDVINDMNGDELDDCLEAGSSRSRMLYLLPTTIS